MVKGRGRKEGVWHSRGDFLFGVEKYVTIQAQLQTESPDTERTSLGPGLSTQIIRPLKQCG